MEKSDRIIMYSIIALIFIIGAYATITTDAQQEGFHDTSYTKTIMSDDSETLDITIDPTPDGVTYGNVLIASNGGNVGIGTNTPSEKLEVNGNIKASGDICSSSQCLNSVSGGSSLWTQSGSNIYRSSGNVGIGTDSPSAKLDVSGDIKAGGATFNGNVGIGTSNPSAKLDVSGDIKATGTICDGSNNCLDTVSGGSSLWTQSGSNIYRSSGNVGIGTSNPSEKLDVSGNLKFTSGADRMIYVDDVADEPGKNLKIHAGGTYMESEDITYKAGDIYLYGGEGESSSHNGDVILAHDGTSAVGNVGIGTSNPSEKLDVNGNIKIGDGSKNPVISLLSGDLQPDNKMVMYYSYNSGSGSSSGDPAFRIYSKDNNGNNNKVQLELYDGSSYTTIIRASENSEFGGGATFNGNVGIGTTSPSARLEVKGGDVIIDLS